MSNNAWYLRCPASCSVTPGYFAALGARLVRGRVFEDADLGRAESVAVLSESAARHLSPSRDPVDRQLFPMPDKKRPRVIGIVGDIKFLATLLYGVTPYDPLTFGGVAVLVAAAALGTCYLTARRVLCLDLLQLLRE